MTLSRRQFLFRAAAAGGATAAAAALPGCLPDLGPAPFVDVPAPVGGRITLALADLPDLAKPGGAVLLRVPGLSGPILVAHAPDGGYAALSGTCTHQGCPVGVDGGEVVCPCHLSRFGLDGQVRHPPAKAPLPTFGVEEDAVAGTVTVVLTAGQAGFPALVNGRVVLPFAQFPELLTPGGSVVGRPEGYGRPIAVMALAGGGYAAVDAVCPHLACTVGFNAGLGQLVCPCHGSRFDTGGGLLQGPATVGLAPFTATADAAAVTVLIPG